MNICYLNHDIRDNTGAGIFCKAFTNALSKEKPDTEIRIITSDDLLSGGVFPLLLKYFKIRCIFKKFDIIHALDGWPYGFIAVVCSLGLGKKVFITAIGSGAVQPLYKPIKKQLLIWVYKKADKVIVVSNHTKKEILKIIPDLKIEVINHGVDFNKFQTTDYKPPTANLKPYILSVGTLKKRKGFECSIKVFAEIADKFPELKYVIVGKGPEKENLRSQILSLKLQDRIVFLDNLSDEQLIGLYKNAELFILLPQDDNKDMEGFGLVFLEAAACGLPVIGSRNSSAEDAISSEKNGFLVSTKQIDEASETIYRILSDNKLREELSKESLWFAKHMSWGKAVKEYLNIYI